MPQSTARHHEASAPRLLHRSLAIGLPALVGVLALAGAARADLRLPDFLGGGPRVVEVAVREVPAEDVWHVAYRLPKKAAGVDLVHRGGSHRRTSWSVLPAGSRWVDVAPGASPAPSARLCFDRPVRELAVSFRGGAPGPPDPGQPVAMSDGGRLLDTGQLVVRPLESCGAEGAMPIEGELVHRFRFSTDAGRTVRVGDRVATGSLAWEPAAGEEPTWVYFGPQVGAVYERLVLVADPALPAWLRRDLERTVIALFDRFAGETGVALPSRALVLLAFDREGGGSSLDGGALGGAVELAARGEGWLTESDEARRDWLVRLGHELFRLWDGAALRPDAESGWLAEAAAEAFALRAAYGLGSLGERELAERLVDLGNRCLAGAGGEPLIATPAGAARESWTTCGPVLLFVAGAAVERAHPGKGGLGLLVREMFAEAQRMGGVYGTATFLGWLDKLAGDRPTVFALQGMIRRGVPSGADRFLARLLAGAGYRVRLAAPDEVKAGPEVFATLLHAGLARCACGAGGAAPSLAPAPPPAGDCARLSGAARLLRVDGVEVRSDPAGAYARLRGAARLGRPLRVVAGDDPQPLELLCGRDTLDPSFEQLLRLE